MGRDHIHLSICSQKTKLSDWYCNKISRISFPIYSSYDIRDAGFKVSNVDGNVYPAGFNNICPVDKETATELFANYLNSKYQGRVKKILLLTEEHTQNPYYWDNVSAIQKHLIEADYKVMVGIPREMTEPLVVTSASGMQVTVHSGFGHNPAVKEFAPDLVISNNDFSLACEEWAKTIQVPINPPRELGWYQRKKSSYFAHYNRLATEFAEVVGFDPFMIRVETELFEHFDMSQEASVHALAERVDLMRENLKKEYAKRGLQQEPFVFVKNNAGTYGLAVIRVSSGQDVLEWSYKSRKKMKAAKGGREVSEVIVQEGIPSRVHSDGASAEPVIYMVGTELAGGFLRTHSEKGATDSLNSPGAVYKRLCVSDLAVSLEGSPLENVYGWTARLGLLAMAEEAVELKAHWS